jgi:hypothetical protein
MPKLTLTSTFASTIMVGDPGYMVIPLPPKETKAVDVTDVQLRQLTPGLEKLKAVGWLNFVVDAAGVKAPEEKKVVAKPSAPPPPPPAPSVIVPPEPEAVVAAPAPVAEAAADVEPDAAPEAPAAPPEATPPATKPNFFEKKNRNR